MEEIDERKKMLDHIYQLPKRIHKHSLPFIAAVNGPAIGGGATLAGFCDLRMAASNAFFILNYVNMGVLPDFGGCYFLPRILGTAKAMELAMLGDKINAQEALNIGLVSRVVNDAEIIGEALKMGGKIAGLPPLAVQHIKKSVYELPGLSMEAALDKEADRFNYLLGTHDCREGAKAFIEKRVPEFTGT
jgi:2-(1,2-epoxy-1,2-dihydrophenyl)acetyl-CoA isomerase